ncbi:diguanylate cyclase domain-containing protein [Thioalkalivibrio sp.]|uniref:diguanylate cyclase domain-containing protein n=1 Tax=Thioalkalivibrio sp. TaxID=2093813 RepID=UPI003561BD25
MTGLPNRALLLDRLSKALAQVRRRELWLAVVFLDLDGFKAINDRHGHQMGDRFLHHLARRMGARLREGDTLARLGGDEFVVILVDLVGPEAVDPLLQRVLRAVSEPVHEDGHDLCVTASLGVTLTRGEPGITPDRLLQEADQAMYRAKEAGRNRYHLSGSPPDSAPGSRP